MVKANNSWLSSQNSSRQLPDLNCMSTLLKTGQQECLPSLADLCTCKLSGPVPLPGSTGPRLQNLRTEQIHEANGQFYGFPTEFHASLPTPSAFVNGKKSAFPFGLSRMVVPDANFSGLCQNGFLIFNQSENQTRLTCNYVCPFIQNPSTAGGRVVSGYEELHKAGLAAQVDQIDQTKNAYCQVSDGNDESEMREDTEEINALLDSDDDDENEIDDECGEDDEVTSTGHSPTEVKEGYQRQEQIHELVEEVASSDGPNKRRKMLDGGYDKSSPLYTATSIKLDGSHEYENDAKSGYASGPAGVEGSDCTLGNMLAKKDKIREILRVLESIIPGVKGKDPLLVIDEAIDYLRITKIKAETLGVSFH